MNDFYHTADLDRAQQEMRENQARAATQRRFERAERDARDSRDRESRQSWLNSKQGPVSSSADQPGPSFGQWLGIHLGLLAGYLFLLTMVCARWLGPFLQSAAEGDTWTKIPAFLSVWLAAHLLLIATLFVRRLLTSSRRARRGLFGRVFFAGVKVGLSAVIAVWWLTSWWQQAGA